MLQGSSVFIPHETLVSLPELLYTKMDVVMDSFFTQISSDELDDIPSTENVMWLLGRKYNPKKGKSIISIQSIIRFEFLFCTK